MVDAVAASCAVPGVWPCVEIAGASSMDGGTRSVANADLARGAERVLVLVLAAAQSASGPAVPEAEFAALEGARLQVVHAEEASLAAFGPNPLDPRTRGPAADAGRTLGRSVAAAVASPWA